MSVFNGKCLIRFSYRRENGEWKLDRRPQQYTIDARAREKINGMLGKIDCIDLPYASKRDPNRLPFIHLGLLLDALSKVKLDGGSVTENCSGQPGNETYSAIIEVKERLDQYRVG